MQAIVKFPVAALLAVLLAVIIALVLAAPSVLARDVEPAPSEPAPLGSVNAGARLAELDLHGVALEPRFDPEQADYQGYMYSREMGSTTLTATAEDADATVAISPADADADVAGHQVDLTAGEEVSVEVTVTSSDGTVEAVYTVAMKYGDGFVKLDVGHSTACALRVDGTVDCWPGWPKMPEPVGIHQDVAAGSKGHLCWINTGGAMDCRAEYTYGPYKDVQAVSMWLYSPCYLKTDGSMRCRGRFTARATSPGPYKSITVGFGHACALTTDNLAECLRYGGHYETPEPETEFKHLESGGRTVCGIRMDDTLLCWKFNGSGWGDNVDQGHTVIDTPDGNFKSVAPTYDFICAVKSEDGSIVCFRYTDQGSANPYSRFIQESIVDKVPEGEFHSVDTGRERACGLKTDGAIVCWGDPLSVYYHFHNKWVHWPGPERSLVSPWADDARLLSLKVRDAAANNVALSPRFNRNTTDGYTAQVPKETTSVTVTPGATNRFAEMEISPPDADPDTEGHQVALDVGTNPVSVTVTSWDDSAEKTYTFEVIRRELRAYNTVPAFDTLHRSVAENSPADTPVGLPVVASDVDADPLTYSLGGADAASFRIDAATGQIYTVDGVDYDYETRPTYSVIVRVDDGYGPSATIKVVINLTDELESEQQNSDGLGSRQWDSIDITHPKRPRDLTASPEAGSVKLSWSQPKEDAGSVTGYVVLRRVEGFEDCGLWPVEDTGNTDTTWTDAGVVAGVSYTYQVRALRGTELSGGSNYQTVEAGAVAGAEPPGSPAGLTAVGTDESRIDLSWVAPDGDPTGYELEWSLDGAAGWVAVDPAHSGTDTSYGHAGLTAGTEYFYRVRALNAAGAGEWSELASATTPAATNTPATGTPTITGTAQVGETLTADVSGIADTDGLTNATFAYQWAAGGVDIAGATGSTYTLVDADAGKDIKVTVSFTDDAGNAESLTSATTDAVAAKANSPATGLPTISGTTQVGETLTVDISGIADQDGLDDVSYSYQWRGDGSDIAGAMGSSYVLTYTEEGKAISVTVSFTDDAGNAETLTSAATAAVEAKANSPATGLPAITGTVQVGETLTADTSGIADADGLTNATFAYQWLADGSDIANATASTYTLVEADEGRAISIMMSFTDDAGNAESLTSEATAAVAGPPPEPLTASFSNGPPSHDGESAFTFDLHFSEEFSVSYKRLRDDAFEVTGGAVRKAQRLERDSNIGWRITVQPSGDGQVVIVLPVTTDCDDDGAICAGDGRMLSNRSELTVGGP